MNAFYYLKVGGKKSTKISDGTKICKKQEHSNFSFWTLFMFNNIIEEDEQKKPTGTITRCRANRVECVLRFATHCNIENGEWVKQVKTRCISDIILIYVNH